MSSLKLFNYVNYLGWFLIYSSRTGLAKAFNYYNIVTVNWLEDLCFDRIQNT